MNKPTVLFGMEKEATAWKQLLRAGKLRLPDLKRMVQSVNHNQNMLFPSMEDAAISMRPIHSKNEIPLPKIDYISKVRNRAEYEAYQFKGDILDPQVGFRAHLSEDFRLPKYENGIFTKKNIRTALGVNDNNLRNFLEVNRENPRGLLYGNQPLIDASHGKRNLSISGRGPLSKSTFSSHLGDPNIILPGRGHIADNELGINMFATKTEAYNKIKEGISLALREEPALGGIQSMSTAFRGSDFVPTRGLKKVRGSKLLQEHDLVVPVPRVSKTLEKTHIGNQLMEETDNLKKTRAERALSGTIDMGFIKADKGVFDSMQSGMLGIDPESPVFKLMSKSTWGSKNSARLPKFLSTNHIIEDKLINGSLDSSMEGIKGLRNTDESLSKFSPFYNPIGNSVATPLHTPISRHELGHWGFITGMPRLEQRKTVNKVIDHFKSIYGDDYKQQMRQWVHQMAKKSPLSARPSVLFNEGAAQVVGSQQNSKSSRKFIQDYIEYGMKDKKLVNSIKESLIRDPSGREAAVLVQMSRNYRFRPRGA